MSQEEDELANMGILTIPEKKPTMSDFKAIIDFYVDLHAELEEKVEEKIIFQTWLEVDCRPFKQGLLNVVNKWGLLYKNHLYEHVLSRSVNETKINNNDPLSAQVLNSCILHFNFYFIMFFQHF